MVWVIAVGVAIAATLWAVMKRPRGRRQANDGRQTRARGRSGRDARAPLGPYAAVAIKPGNDSCARVLEQVNTRYLESAAPTIPVTGCDCTNCQCSFVHFPDRRADADGDRRMGIGLQSELYGSSGNAERRQRRGRRMGD